MTTIEIPFKSHLKKFLLKRYEKEPIISEEHTMLGKHIMSILVDKRSRTKNENDQFNTTLKLHLSTEMAKRSPLARKLIRLNDLVEKDFKEALILWIHAQSVAGINPYNSSRLFVEYFDFTPEEYTHDAAQRAWLRYKNNEYRLSKKNRNCVVK